MADEIKPENKPRKHPTAERIRYIRDQITPTWEEAKNLITIPKETKFLGVFKKRTKNYWKTRKETAESLYRKEQEGQTDSLTGLLNRNGVLKRLNAEINRAKRLNEKIGIGNKLNEETNETKIKKTGMTMFFLDLNNLKEFNTLSQSKGDELIKNTAKGLSITARPSDIIGRWGGDEFVVILPDTDIPEALLYWERTKDNLKNTFNVWLSAGLVKVNLDNIDETLNAADSAMKEAKNLAKEIKNRVGIRENTLKTVEGASTISPGK